MSLTLEMRPSNACKMVIRKNITYLSWTQKCHLSNVKMTFNDMAYFLLFKLKTLRCGVYDRVYIKGVAGLYLPLCRKIRLAYILFRNLFFYRELKLLAHLICIQYSPDFVQFSENQMYFTDFPRKNRLTSKRWEFRSMLHCHENLLHDFLLFLRKRSPMGT